MSFRKRLGLVGLGVIAAGCTYPEIDLGDLPHHPSDPGGVSGSTGSGGAGHTGGTAAGGSGTAGATARQVVQVAAGWYHTCALLTDGSVSCWGDNYGGQLGDGTTVVHLQPAPVLGLSGAPVRIDADYTGSCAQYADGSLECWGSNNYGQLGDGTTTTRPLPTPVLIDPVSQISQGEYHACAAMLDGTVRCWGYNLTGGLGLAAEQALLPTPIAGIADVTAVSAGANITCVLHSNQTVSCWGAHGGAAFCDQSPVPASEAAVPGVTGVTQIAAGSTHVCALLSAGNVECWGNNFYGQLGEPATTTATPPCETDVGRGPAVVMGLSGVRQITAGDGHSCALLDSGKVACWGSNSAGQLGDGTTVNRSTPVFVEGIVDAVQISAGMVQTCAVLADGSLSCWGNLFNVGDRSPQPLPKRVEF